MLQVPNQGTRPGPQGCLLIFYFQASKIHREARRSLRAQLGVTEKVSVFEGATFFEGPELAIVTATRMPNNTVVVLEGAGHILAARQRGPDTTVRVKWVDCSTLWSF